MFFKQFYLGCLAQASYMIGSDGEAAVVDPRRDVDAYLEEAESAGLRSATSSRPTSTPTSCRATASSPQRTGAKIYFGAPGRREVRRTARPTTATRSRFGDVTLRFLETPGHTPESVSVLVFDRSLGRAARRRS